MNSIRVRVLLALLGMLAVTALVMGGLTYRNVLAETEALFDYQLRQMALSLRDQGEIGPEDARALADGQLDFVIQIWHEDGQTVYSTRPQVEPPSRAVLGFADIQSSTELWRTFGVLARDRVIQVAQPERVRHQRAAQAALRSVVPLLAVAPALALVIGWLVSRSLAPLQRLAVEVRARDSGSLQALPVAGLPEEVLPLVQSLNALLDRLGAALAAQRHFVGDAAHELRSPLTALKLQVQVMRRAPDDAARDAAARALTAGVDRATRLVEQLLALARSEAGPLREATAAPLAELVRQAMADVAPFADARATTLELDVADGADTLAVTGDADVSVLARNLIDNAVRYSPHGGHVWVWVGTEAAHPSAPVLQVDDDGPGIPEADREMVFDRFVRRDNAADQTGSGLGLAIVRQVALRQGAAVALSESPAGGLRVRVTWPARA